jgi:hypothetical protein
MRNECHLIIHLTFVTSDISGGSYVRTAQLPSGHTHSSASITIHGFNFGSQGIQQLQMYIESVLFENLTTVGDPSR